MARNGSGTYAVPNTFTAGTTITASDHNENWSDVGSEVTNSVAADGQTTMTGPLKASSGTVAAPSLTFGADTDTGFYRIGADQLGAAIGGTKIVDIASTGATITGSVDATTIKQGGYALIPAGVTVPYAGASAPDGWLFCYGQAVSRTTYASLFAAVATTYGSGDGSTTFNLPDMRGRVVAGQDDMGGSSANRLTGQTDGVDGDVLGGAGGTETHTLTSAQIPTHTHSVSINDHPKTAIRELDAENTYAASGATSGASNAAFRSGTTPASNSICTPVLAHTVTVGNTGDGGAHNNVQPTIILNYIIKT